MKTGVIIQARLGSKRFPRKVLADLCGKPMLQHVIDRAKKIKANKHILAVPNGDQQEFAEFAWGIKLMAPMVEEEDVLLRFFTVAFAEKLDVILRITADCPLIEPAVCQEVLDAVTKYKVEYASNIMPRTWPKGLDCEAFTFETLERAQLEAKDEYEREHVTPWMQANCLKTFNLVNPKNPRHLAAIADDNWSVDTPVDLERAREVIFREQYLEDAMPKPSPKVSMQVSGFKSE